MLTFEDADGFGFVRDRASLAIVIVGDEADCSMQVEPTRRMVLSGLNFLASALSFLLIAGRRP